jgi:GntR family transcriptional regulator
MRQNRQNGKGQNGKGQNGTPIYKKIQQTILKRVESGHLKPGDAVDSERELARIHGVSLMTARHALAGLEREGLVERRRGTGTFVAPPKIHFNKLMSYTEQMGSRSLPVSSKILSFKVVTNEHEIAARLALPGHSSLIKLERLRLSAAEPFAIETCYLSANQFEGLTSAPLERGSLFSLLKHDYGVEIAHADEEIDATSADPWSGRVLSVVPGSPLLRIRQLIHSTKGQAIMYVLGLYRSDRHTLLCRRFR